MKHFTLFRYSIVYKYFFINTKCIKTFQQKSQKIYMHAKNFANKWTWIPLNRLYHLSQKQTIGYNMFFFFFGINFNFVKISIYHLYKATHNQSYVTKSYRFFFKLVYKSYSISRCFINWNTLINVYYSKSEMHNKIAIKKMAMKQRA